MASVAAIPDAIAIVVCALAVATDLRSRRIPNRLTVVAAACGVALNTAHGVVSGTGLQCLVAALAGAALGLIVFGVPAALDLVGMGDVKLVAALGALVRWPLALPMVFYIALAGGLLALGYAVAQRRVGAVARNVIGRKRTALHRMPYAAAIAIGCVWAVASRQIEVLRLLDL